MKTALPFRTFLFALSVCLGAHVASIAKAQESSLNIAAQISTLKVCSFNSENDYTVVGRTPSWIALKYTKIACMGEFGFLVRYDGARFEISSDNDCQRLLQHIRNSSSETCFNIFLNESQQTVEGAQ